MIDSRTRAVARSVVAEAAFDRATELLNYGNTEQAKELFEAIDIVKRPTDTEVVEQIHSVMSGKEWDADTLDLIASAIESTGRIIDSY